MRKPTYLSPSSLSTFEKDPTSFYTTYIADRRLPREPQTAPMAVGSAFDAYVKSALYQDHIGDGDASHTVEYLFNRQVEPHGREQAAKDGMEVFNLYKKCGAYDSLSQMLKNTIGPPKFETEITGTIEGVPLLGRPDLYFIHEKSARVIHDWKVNGFYSNTPPPPKPGYLKMFPGGNSHPKAMPAIHKGLFTSQNHPLNLVDETWATQLCTYAWVLGEPIGGDFIVMIDQIVCDKITKVHRVARHSSIVTDKFQRKTIERYKRCWQAIESGHIFLDGSYEESLQKCKTLDFLIESGHDAQQNMTDDEKAFAALTAPPKRFR